MAFDFDLDTAVTRVSEGRYRAEITDRWDIHTVPNGGYVMAVAARALRQHLDHPDPFSITGHFLRPVQPGPAEITVDVLKAGRTLTYAEAQLAQDGEAKLRVTAAYGDFERRDGFDYCDEPPPQMPPVPECLSPRIPVRFLQSVRAAFTPDTADWLAGEQSDRCELAGWIQFADGREPDALALVMFADGFPPPVFRHIGPVGWVPTVEMTVQVRHNPAPGPLRCRFRTRHITGGFAEEDGEIWDSEDRLVALSRQLETIRLPDRNA